MHALPTSAQDVLIDIEEAPKVKQMKHGKVWQVCEARNITVLTSHFGNKSLNFLDNKHTARIEE